MALVGSWWKAGARGAGARKVGRSGAAQAGADDGEQDRWFAARIGEAVWKIGVERDGVARGQRVCLAVDLEHDTTAIDEGDLSAARLVHRRIAGAARGGPRIELVAGELEALPGQRGREDLEGVPPTPPPVRRSSARTTVTAPLSSRRSSWLRRRSRPLAIFAATCSVGLVSERSTC